MPNWSFGKNDQFFVADFDGNNKKDLFVFNGADYETRCFGLIKSSGTNLSLIQSYDANLPGWQMNKNVRYYVGDFNDQKADRALARHPAEKYLRLNARLHEGEMSVQEVSEVEAPLLELDLSPCGFAYVVTLSDRRLAVGDLPDLGIRRSYPSPDPGDDLSRHHIAPAPETAFNVRVPEVDSPWQPCQQLRSCSIVSKMAHRRSPFVPAPSPLNSASNCPKSHGLKAFNSSRSQAP